MNVVRSIEIEGCEDRIFREIIIVRADNAGTQAGGLAVYGVAVRNWRNDSWESIDGQKLCAPAGSWVAFERVARWFGRLDTAEAAVAKLRVRG